MAVNGVEIKVGQKWKTRGGAEVEIIAFNERSKWSWVVSNGTTVTNEGVEWSPEGQNDFDLVELVSKLGPKYTVDEFYEALQNAVSSSRSDVEKYLANKHDPEYAEYVRLKAKFES